MLENIMQSIYEISAMDWQTLVITLYAVLFLTSALHEGLHYLVAKVLKFDVKKLKIGSFNIYENESLSVGLIPVKNLVEWYPSEETLSTKDFNYKVAAVFLAGPIGNLITLILGLTTNTVFTPMLIALSAVLFITNILPIMPGVDGWYICKAMYYQWVKKENLTE